MLLPEDLFFEKTKKPNNAELKIKYLNTQLLINAENGNLLAVSGLLRQGANPNARNKNNETALHRAAFKGHYEIMQILLFKGANKYAYVSTKSARTPFNYAILSNADIKIKLKAIETLINFGYDINHTQFDCQKMPLEDACKSKSVEIVDYLLREGASVILAPKAIFKAVESTKILQLLIDHQADVNVSKGFKRVYDKNAYYNNESLDFVYDLKPKTGATPLHIAAAGCNIKAVEILINAGADRSRLDWCDRTPLNILQQQHAHYLQNYSMTPKIQRHFDIIYDLLS